MLKQSKRRVKRIYVDRDNRILSIVQVPGALYMKSMINIFVGYASCVSDRRLRSGLCAVFSLEYKELAGQSLLLIGTSAIPCLHTCSSRSVNSVKLHFDLAGVTTLVRPSLPQLSFLL